MKLYLDLKEHVGERFSAFIENTCIPEGRIQLYNNDIYLCQNILVGSSCPDKLGYKHSWIIPDELFKLKNDLYSRGEISRLILLDEDQEKIINIDEKEIGRAHV